MKKPEHVWLLIEMQLLTKCIDLQHVVICRVSDEVLGQDNVNGCDSETVSILQCTHQDSYDW